MDWERNGEKRQAPVQSVEPPPTTSSAKRDHLSSVQTAWLIKRSRNLESQDRRSVDHGLTGYSQELRAGPLSMRRCNRPIRTIHSAASCVLLTKYLVLSGRTITRAITTSASKEHSASSIRNIQLHKENGFQGSIEMRLLPRFSIV